MYGKHRILVAVDDSDASRRAVAYTAGLLSGCTDVSVRLLRVLPHLPPETLEWGGTEPPARERELLGRERAQFVAQAEATAQPMVLQMKEMLLESGIPEHAVEMQFYPSVATADIVDDILDVARQEDFDTVVVGRSSWARLREVFRHHVCHELVKKAHCVAVWVIE